MIKVNSDFIQIFLVFTLLSFSLLPAAINEYQRALVLGDRNPEVLGRSARAFLRYGRDPSRTLELLNALTVAGDERWQQWAAVELGRVQGAGP